MSSDQTGVECPIKRQRGDTFPFVLRLTDKDSGAPIDLTGGTFLLTVDPSPEPPDAANNLFQNVPVITNLPGTDGRITITLSSLEADQVPSEYFYDLQLTDVGGAIRTLVKDTFEFAQDITK
jgi:hypothetical protein